MEADDDITGIEVALFLILYGLVPLAIAVLVGSAWGVWWGVAAYFIGAFCVFLCELMCR